MSKLITLFALLLILLSFTLSYAARREHDQLKNQFENIEKESIKAADEICEGLEKEECLMKRTLAAHVDYIYTQHLDHP
ncbi:hypothetical protein Nepgr_015487 [Nepenthes gracilis]|uniref:Phytosulfokine n=1 Tax=Nepenthes gracilis TaxID=150966 RepID=A0AAD3SNP8_NEPGR|nr:hypothetical protein Nepgr_015487 [Nepenthes gracilis]